MHKTSDPEAGNLPLGWVADIYGRKIVLSLHKINMMCTGGLTILVCNSALHMAVGGGSY